MNRSASFMVIFPAMAFVSALALAVAVPVLMRSPEILIGTVLEQRSQIAGWDGEQRSQTDYSIARRVLTGIDRPREWSRSQYMAEDIVPIGWQGPANVGDRITITRGDGELMELEITGVRAFESPLRNVSNVSSTSQLVMLTAKMVGKPDAPALRMFLEAETPAPFVLEADGAQSL